MFFYFLLFFNWTFSYRPVDHHINNCPDDERDDRNDSEKAETDTNEFDTLAIDQSHNTKTESQSTHFGWNWRLDEQQSANQRYDLQKRHVE